MKSDPRKIVATLVIPIFIPLPLQFLDEAQSMQPQRRDSSCTQHQGLHLQLDEPGKEPFGPACRDYFWVLCRSVMRHVRLYYSTRLDVT